MKRIIHATLVATLSLGFSTCQGSQSKQAGQSTQEAQAIPSAPAVQSVELLPEIIYEQIPFEELKKHRIETAEQMFDSEHSSSSTHLPIINKMVRLRSQPKRDLTSLRTTGCQSTKRMVWITLT